MFAVIFFNLTAGVIFENSDYPSDISQFEDIELSAPEKVDILLQKYSSKELNASISIKAFRSMTLFFSKKRKALIQDNQQKLCKFTSNIEGYQSFVNIETRLATNIYLEKKINTIHSIKESNVYETAFDNCLIKAMEDTVKEFNTDDLLLENIDNITKLSSSICMDDKTDDSYSSILLNLDTSEFSDDIAKLSSLWNDFKTKMDYQPTLFYYDSRLKHDINSCIEIYSYQGTEFSEAFQHPSSLIKV